MLSQPSLTVPWFAQSRPAISYAYHALSDIPGIEAMFGTKVMGPFREDILQRRPDWQDYGLAMPIESEDAGGDCAIIVDSPDYLPHANGLVTNKPGIVLIGYGADCPGVLAASDDGSVVGMFHAAWWAQADNGVGKMVDGFKQFGIKPEQIHATIGPCIAAENYQIRTDDRFCATLQAKKQLMLDFIDHGTSCFDTRASTEALLREQGVEHINHIRLDTYTTLDDNGETLFYSARRGKPANHNNPWAIRILPH